MPFVLEDQLAVALRACGRVLEQGFSSRILEQLGPYARAASAFDFLSKIGQDPESDKQLARLCAPGPSPAGQNAVERTLLVLASQHAVGLLPAVPVCDRVKALFAEEFLFFADPSNLWLPHFRYDDMRYREMVRIATLRRFPAGLFQWEVSGFPRSWVLKSRHPWKTLHFVVTRMGGFGPLFEMHLNARRKNNFLLVEKAASISYYRAACSMQKQPGVKGLTLGSWLFCESTAKISPHLAWLRRIPQEAGALIVELGAAPPDSGFLTGSEERRDKYKRGIYRPKLTCVLWPRPQLIAWAKQHPEFDR